MQTEFTCGRYTAKYYNINNRWLVKTPMLDIGLIMPNGATIELITHSENNTALDYSANAIKCIFELMNNIKRQYKQLNNA